MHFQMLSKIAFSTGEFKYETSLRKRIPRRFLYDTEETL